MPGRLPYGGRIAVRRAGRYPHQEPPCCIFQRHRATPSFTYGMTNRCSASATSTFRSSFRACRADFQSRPLLHRDNLRHGIEQNTGSCPIRRIFAPRQIRYTLYYYVEFRHLTVFALYRMEIYPAQPMGGSPFRQRQRFRNGELLENIL